MVNVLWWHGEVEGRHVMVWHYLNMELALYTSIQCKTMWEDKMKVYNKWNIALPQCRISCTAGIGVVTVVGNGWWLETQWLPMRPRTLLTEYGGPALQCIGNIWQVSWVGWEVIQEEFPMHSNYCNYSKQRGNVNEHWAMLLRFQSMVWTTERCLLLWA